MSSRGSSADWCSGVLSDGGEEQLTFGNSDRPDSTGGRATASCKAVKNLYFFICTLRREVGLIISRDGIQPTVAYTHNLPTVNVPDYPFL